MLIRFPKLFYSYLLSFSIEDAFLKLRDSILLLTLLTVIPLLAVSCAHASDTIELTATENHHVIELNSDQPYVAGYHVDTPNLYTLEGVNATSVTVSFPSTDTHYFPSRSWLGAGMFVQAQDIRLRHVDYGFYTMLVLEASGGFFLDVGLHETRESTAPIQMPTEELIYAYTWQIKGIDAANPVTLLAQWDAEGSVHYTISASGTSIAVLSVNVAALPKCESIIKNFFAGNFYSGTAFPHGHYGYYFQFGVVSSENIIDNHWSVDLKDPKILRRKEWRLGSGWHSVETAWSTQGDISYIDADWMWGGAAYKGVSAKYQQNPYEVIFFYNGQTLQPGTVLWQHTNSSLNWTPTVQTQATHSILSFAIGAIIATGTASGEIVIKMKRPRLQTDKER
jgi:hypothetical protein